MSDHYTKPNLSRAALITIDMQNDLPGAIAEIAGTHDRLPAMRIVLNEMRAAGRPIIHVVRLYERDGSNAELCRKAAIENGKAVAAPGTEGAWIVNATTIYEASERDFKIGMVSDAISGVYDKGLDEVRNIGVYVWTTEQFRQWNVQERNFLVQG